MKKVALHHIEYADNWNLHPFLTPDPSTPLCLSIAKLGILHPPILVEQSTNSYQVVCGRYRLRALRCVEPTEQFTNCLVLAGNTTPEELLHYTVEDQLLSGCFSPMEKGYFFNKALRFLDLKEAGKYFETVLGEPIPPHEIKKSLHLLKLETELQHSVHKGKINEKLAVELLRLDPGERQILHTLFLNLGFGGGKQKRLVSLSRDLAFKEGIHISQLSQDPEVAAILKHPEMNGPQKGTTLLTYLQRRLFPQSSAAEEEFTKRVNRMKLPSGCAVSHSQAFEKDEVSVGLRFRSLAEVEKHLAEIQSIMK